MNALASWKVKKMFTSRQLKFANFPPPSQWLLTKFCDIFKSSISDAGEMKKIALASLSPTWKINHFCVCVCVWAEGLKSSFFGKISGVQIFFPATLKERRKVHHFDVLFSDLIWRENLPLSPEKGSLAYNHAILYRSFFARKKRPLFLAMTQR